MDVSGSRWLIVRIHVLERGGRRNSQLLSSACTRATVAMGSPIGPRWERWLETLRDDDKLDERQRRSGSARSHGIVGTRRRSPRCICSPNRTSRHGASAPSITKLVELPLSVLMKTRHRIIAVLVLLLAATIVVLVSIYSACDHLMAA